MQLIRSVTVVSVHTVVKHINPIVRSDGKPFPKQSKRQHKHSKPIKKTKPKKNRQSQRNHAVVTPVDGGYAVVPKVELNSKQQLKSL